MLWGASLASLLLATAGRAEDDAGERPPTSIPWMKSPRVAQRDGLPNAARYAPTPDSNPPQIMPGDCQYPTTGPLTVRPTPPGDLPGKLLCHRSFSGDCYGDNWRLKRWYGNNWCGRFHEKMHCHSLGCERFIKGICCKPMQGYVHDTSGYPLKSFFVPQPDDPSIPAVPDALSAVYDYPQYVVYPGANRHMPSSEPVIIK